MHLPSGLRRAGRSPPRRLVALVAAPLLGVSLIAAVPSTATTTDGTDQTAIPPAAPDADFSALPGNAEPTAVTLITGDTVYWSDTSDGDPGVVEIEEAPRDVPVHFYRSGTQEDFYVIPSDVMEHVVSGALDMELFNVPSLVRQGLDDESTGGELPVIVTFDESADAKTLERDADALPAASEAQGIEGVQGAGVKVDRGEAAKFRDTVLGEPDAKRGLGAQSDSLDGAVDKVLLDQMLEIDLSESVPQIGAPAAWDAGFTGEGVTVAVLDTGVDASHPDLAGQVVDRQSFVTPHPRFGVFAVEQLDRQVRYVDVVGALPVPKQGSADPLVYVGRACVDSEGDELLADPAGKTALIDHPAPTETCTFAEKYDAAVEAGATAVVFVNNGPGLLNATIEGAEHEGEVWAAMVTEFDGAALIELLNAAEEVVVLGLSDQPFVGDDNGHGTHVASTIAGTGAASDGARKGVAPDAELLSGKVCDFLGQCFTSDVMAAMEWAANQGADVVNMSLGSDLASDGTDPQSQLLNQLSNETGVLFVTSAGNAGGFQRVGSPAAADAALAVGAVDKSDQMADFSSRGPRIDDHAVKPEITAPGVGIVAARAAGTGIGDPVDDAYTAVNGTSMASPHVAGAAALLAQANPDLDGEALKDALVSTAADGGHMWFEQGTGRVEVPAALDSPVYASGTLNFGGVDGQAERDLVYTNHSAQDVTLSLDAAVTDTNGSDTDAAGVALSTDTLTVPAHGTASVAVTATLGADVSVQEAFGGIVSATGDGVDLRTGIGFGQYQPKVTIEVLDSHGDRTGSETAADSLVWLTHDTWDPDDGGPSGYVLPGPEGVATGHVPSGTYTIGTTVDEYEANEAGTPLEFTRLSMLVEVEVDITADTTIVLDARDAVPLQVSAPRKADKRYHAATMFRELPGGAGGSFTPQHLVRPGRSTSRLRHLGSWRRLACSSTGRWPNPNPCNPSPGRQTASNVSAAALEFPTGVTARRQPISTIWRSCTRMVSRTTCISGSLGGI